MGPVEVDVMTTAREHGAEAILTGANGDALFDGVPQSLSELVKAGQWREAVRAVRALEGFYWEERSLVRWLLRPIVAAHVPWRLRWLNARRSTPWLPDWAGPVLRDVLWRRWEARRARVKATLRGGPEGPGRRGPREEEPWPPAAYRVVHAWYRHQHEVAVGLERRDPYFDPALIATVRGFRPDWFLHGGVRRGLFREAMRGLLPESLRTRLDKAGFEPAMFRFVEAAGGFGSLRPLSRASRLAALGLVEPRPFGEAFDELARAPLASYGWGAVWSALAVEAFLERRAGVERWT
jgi:asparagine synthase (glutamine-hydrolysing)